MNFRFHSRVFSLLTSSTIILSLCGCSSEEKNGSFNGYSTTSFTSGSVGSGDITSNSSTIYTTSFSETSNFSEPVSTTIVSSSFSQTSFSSSVSSTNLTTSTGVVTSYTDDDLNVLNYFRSIGDSIKNNIDSSEVLDKAKAYFVSCVDFLFYDSDIGGVTFNELTSGTKKELLSYVSYIDDLICSKYPNYKESISDGGASVYNKASSIIKSGSKNLKDFSREKLGDDNYSKLEKYKDLFKEQAKSDFDDFKDIVGNGKKKVKEWYENWRTK